MLQLVDAIIRLELIEHDNALQLARVIGSSMQRIAQAQVDAAAAGQAEVPDGPVDPDDAVRRAELLLPTMPKVLEYAWRRHLQSTVRLRLAQADLSDDGPPPRAVGFADLVGFTVLSQQLDDHELAEVVERFETTAYDVVSAHGGRVVKMIGDEVMYEVPDPASAALIGLELSDAFHDDETVNDVRVGIAYGPALAREGDLFGPTVNLAARLVGIAYGGAVVTSAEVREALADDDRFVFKGMRGRYLKNIGRVRLYVLRRSGDTAEGIADRARRRRGVLGDRLVEMVDRTLASAPAGDRSDEEE
jgi:adenylate cyclase